jgi:hypothetical protein
MYAIIKYSNGSILPEMEHGVLKVFTDLKEADNEAFEIEKGGSFECRVISLDSVHE